MAEIQTFRLPERVTGSEEDARLGRGLVWAWQSAGSFQVVTDRTLDHMTANAYAAGKRFFAQPADAKAKHVSDLTYSGYFASGEGGAGDPAGRPEVFTVCKDVPEHDARVQGRWPCHGPTPWPDREYMLAMRQFMARLGEIGEKLLELIALGLGLPDRTTLTRLTRDGWNHMRVLRFPARIERASRGIDVHTDCALLVLAARDGEDGLLAAYPGDILEFLTGGMLSATPREVGSADRERYAVAYFHAPNFEACVRPFDDPDGAEFIHYGTHFTDLFMRDYPDRATTKRILDEDRLTVLARLREHALAHA